VRNEEVSQTDTKDKNILRTVKRRKAYWIGHILCRKLPCKIGVEGKLEKRLKLKERRGGRRKQLLYDLKETKDID
jgi:hypothetical protein